MCCHGAPPSTCRSKFWLLVSDTFPDVAQSIPKSKVRQVIVVPEESALSEAISRIVRQSSLLSKVPDFVNALICPFSTGCLHQLSSSKLSTLRKAFLPFPYYGFCWEKHLQRMSTTFNHSHCVVVKLMQTLWIQLLDRGNVNTQSSVVVF